MVCPNALSTAVDTARNGMTIHSLQKCTQSQWRYSGPNSCKVSMTASSHVRVVARIRPLSQSEKQRGSKASITSMASESEQRQESESSCSLSEPELIQANAGGGGSTGKRWFELDAVFDQFSTQHEVYERSGTREAVCEDLFRGYNATILAYGQTGAGKTHTMGSAVREGQHTSVSQDDGIIPRACVDLFKNVRDKCDGNARVELSYLEIYNEEIRDLLATAACATSSSNRDLKIRETLHGEVYVSGLTEKEVLSTEHVGRLMEEASKRRVVASTAMNATSSRSHAICTLRISGVVENNIERSGEMDKFTAKLTLVDLAGSERIKKTNAQGNQRQEGISINKGLFVLGQVVSALSEHGGGGSSASRKPPFRESKLTRLLQNSLGGNSRTIMVACVSPADFNMDESINTLRYATSARRIQSNATRNIIRNISPQEAAALLRENQLLKNEVVELQETVKKLTQSGLVLDSTTLVSMDGCDSSRNDDSLASTPREEGSGGGTEDSSSMARVASLERQVASLKSKLRSSQEGLRESTRDAAIELPAMKVELQLLREKLRSLNNVQDENLSLMAQLQEARSDADSARIAAAKLSAILDQLKELRRDEIDKKKEELKYMKKDEAWVVFMHTLLEGRGERVKALSQDFMLVMKVMDNPSAFSREEQVDSRSSWWGTRREEKRDVLDPELRQRVINEHMEFFKDRVDELQQDINLESDSLEQMRKSIQKDCSILQDEIGKDEMKDERFDKVGRSDMLQKLKQVWATSNRSLTSP